MARVKNGNIATKRRRKILKLAKGFVGAKKLLFKTAKQQVIKSFQYAYRDRRKRKSNFRKLWIVRINAAVREHDLNYSTFMNGLKKAGLVVNRKMLADLALNNKEIFNNFVIKAKNAL